MSAILTFLGGSAFRAIFGEISSWLTKKQDAKLEIERMTVQNQLDDAKSVRDLNAIKVQADMQIKVVQVQGEASVSTAEAEAFKAAMAVANAPSGVKWVDGWNACVRPAFASVALGLWVFHLASAGWALAEWDLSLMGAIAGYFFADRHMGKSGK